MNKHQIKNLVNNDNAVIFEIGCADGIDTIEFINTFPSTTQFYCFEPDVRNAEVFTKGGHRPLDPTNSNPIVSDNLKFFQKAIGNVNGQIEFNQSTTIYSSSLKKPTQNLFNQWPQIEFHEKLIVECITLDSFVDEHSLKIIDFIWADVQGAEDLMIMGGRDTFDNKVRYLYTECVNSDTGIKYYEYSPTKEDILQLLGPNWILMADLKGDILLKNTKLS